jgi:hypothetical protein
MGLSLTHHHCRNVSRMCTKEHVIKEDLLDVEKGDNMIIKSSSMPGSGFRPLTLYTQRASAH